MFLGAQCAAAVLENDHFIIAVVPFTHSRLYDGIRGDAGAIDALDAIGAQHSFQLCGIERADAVFNDVEVFFTFAKVGVDFRTPPAQLEDAVLAGAGENRRIGRAFTVVWGKTDADKANGNAGCAGFVEDRKSTRLNSSHVKISYAVFCL